MKTVEMTDKEFQEWQMFKQGKEGEQCARLWLKEHGIKNIFQLDWVFEDPKTKGKYYAMEVKNKERFEPRPEYGPQYEAQGLDNRQVLARSDFYEATKIPSLLWVSDVKTHEIRYEWLHILNKKADICNQYFLTKNGIRLYNLDFFRKDSEYINRKGFLCIK